MDKIKNWQIGLAGLIIVLIGKILVDNFGGDFLIFILVLGGYMLLNFSLNLYYLQRDSRFFSGASTIGAKKTLKYVLIAMFLPGVFNRFFLDYIKAKNDPFLTNVRAKKNLMKSEKENNSK